MAIAAIRKALPRDTAKAIYLSQYWTEPKFDRIAELSPVIAQELCDTGVNMGPRVASTFLALVIGAEYAGQSISGPEAGRRDRQHHYCSAEKLSGRSRQIWRNHAAEGAECSQGARYLELAEARAANEDFLYGWVKERVEL